jgi:hypothetical protein
MSSPNGVAYCTLMADIRALDKRIIKDGLAKKRETQTFDPKSEKNMDFMETVEDLARLQKAYRTLAESMYHELDKKHEVLPPYWWPQPEKKAGASMKGGGV